MNREQLISAIKRKRSFLCVGLDTDIERIPEVYKSADDPILAFNQAVIDATKDVAVAYKPNLAFYESLGAAGLISLRKTLEYIPDDIFTIADAKRGDIGNTSELYARAFFQQMGFDSITLSPYMGSDSIQPYYKYEGKWLIVLAVTSNPGALDFQFQVVAPGHQKLYEKVLEHTRRWGNEYNTMYVVGATRADVLQRVRSHVPRHFLLIPGVGAQGGSLRQVCDNGLNADIGLLVNSSRGIIYADGAATHKESVRQAATELQEQMEQILRDRGLV